MADVIITFVDEQKNISHDLIVSDEMSADELIDALSQSYMLKGKEKREQKFMRMEYPIGLVRGEYSLGQIGVRNGTIVYSGKKG